MKASALLLAALLAPATAFAVAPNFQYDYLDLGHVRLSPQNGQDGSGPFADLAYSILDTVQFRAGYQRLDYGSLPGAPSYKDYDFGFTGESALSDSTDIYTDLLYLNHPSGIVGTSATTDDGYRLAIGLRHRAWSRLEFDAWLAHDYLNVPANEVGLGVLVDATSWLALGASYAHANNQYNTLTLRLRLYLSSPGT